MKKISLLAACFAILMLAVAWSQTAGKKSDLPGSGLQISSDAKNPWTHLKVNNNPDQFQFAIISDRTGGRREKIFSKAVEQLNLMQPEFVMSVGDLIDGSITDQEKITAQWKEFQGFTAKLQMPFFYVPGNHDVGNKELDAIWQQKFGKRNYHFVYRDVLFLCLNTDDPPGTTAIAKEQQEYAAKTLAENKDVRWTIVFLHKPIWTGDNEKNGWGAVEKSLQGRNYTVYAGHVHRYQKFVRNGMNYYQLATTGGGSRLRGVKYGEFDHFVWVTMKKNGPVMANIMLDGVLGEDLSLPETNEPVTVYNRKPVQPVKGTVYIDGVVAAGATISFHLPNPAKKAGFTYVGDALIDGDGTFAPSTYALGDGLPADEYVVTIAYDGRYRASGERAGMIPEKYSKPTTSPLKAVIKTGKNDLSFDLISEPPMKLEKLDKIEKSKP